jgi:hypothetical protein
MIDPASYVFNPIGLTRMHRWTAVVREQKILGRTPATS